MIKIQYQTQRLSLRFFLLMLVLFVFQAGFGMLLSLQQVDPALLAGIFNFNVARAEHLNLGIIWILCGFIGTILFVGPLLSNRELAAPWLIKFLFIAARGSHHMERVYPVPCPGGRCRLVAGAAHAARRA